jgi:hypothetical protein
MDAATVVVLVLSAGVIALLAWFEINSRRNDANMQSKPTLAQSGLEGLKKKSQAAVESDTQKRKPA